MEQNSSKNILYLHIAVMLFSVSGVIGQFVEVPSVLVAMGRVICSSMILFTIAKVKKNNLALECKKDYALIIAKDRVEQLYNFYNPTKFISYCDSSQFISADTLGTQTVKIKEK